jgi:hypothetical protein
MATWNESQPGVSWSDPGCDGPRDATLVCRGPVLLTVTLDLGTATLALPIDLVQRWIDDPASNDGLLLRIDEAFAGAHRLTLISSEGAAGTRPELELVFD